MEANPEPEAASPKGEERVEQSRIGHRKVVPLGSRIFGVLILLIMVGLSFVYGFEGRIRLVDNSSAITT